MTQLGFVEVPASNHPKPGTATVVRVSGINVALFNVDGRIFAINDFCVRCGASLAEGCISGPHVTCRQCGWCYDVSTGRLTELPALTTGRFEVQVVDSLILVATASTVTAH
jgi:nitrite reductase (NADH) small subunit/3-phenylpropionate/trans-cinnamate dioxygenase ferredoxin subunit